MEMEEYLNGIEVDSAESSDFFTDALRSAFLFSLMRHGEQRYGEHPFMYHLISVYKVACDFNLSEDIRVAALLHDIIEDTNTLYWEVKKEFGVKVAELVFAVTDERGRNRKERHEKTYPKMLDINEDWNNDASDDSPIWLKVCDRIANCEFSKENKEEKRLKMYRDEYPEFNQQLNLGTKPDMWKRLEEALE